MIAFCYIAKLFQSAKIIAESPGPAGGPPPAGEPPGPDGTRRYSGPGRRFFCAAPLTGNFKGKPYRLKIKNTYIGKLEITSIYMKFA
jgi:hypothetical protein